MNGYCTHFGHQTKLNPNGTAIMKELISLCMCAFVSRYIFGAFAKLRKVTISLVVSVLPHDKTRLPLEGFSLNLIFAYFSKACRENSSVIETW